MASLHGLRSRCDKVSGHFSSGPVEIGVPLAFRQHPLKAFTPRFAGGLILAKCPPKLALHCPARGRPVGSVLTFYPPRPQEAASPLGRRHPWSLVQRRVSRSGECRPAGGRAGPRAFSLSFRRPRSAAARSSLRLGPASRLCPPPPRRWCGFLRQTPSESSPGHTQVPAPQQLPCASGLVLDI